MTINTDPRARPGYYTDGLRPDPGFDPVIRLQQLEDAIADLTYRIPAIGREIAAIRELLQRPPR